MAIKAINHSEGPTSTRNTPASTAIIMDRPLVVLNNNFALAASGAIIEYLASGTKAAGDASTRPIDARRVIQGQEYEFDLGNGTMTDALVDTSVNLWASDLTRLDVVTIANADVKITGWNGQPQPNTKIYGIFTRPGF